jgi:hypothetical protein
MPDLGRGMIFPPEPAWPGGGSESELAPDEVCRMDGHDYGPGGVCRQCGWERWVPAQAVDRDEGRRAA